MFQHIVIKNNKKSVYTVDKCFITKMCFIQVELLDQIMYIELVEKCVQVDI